MTWVIVALACWPVISLIVGLLLGRALSVSSGRAPTPARSVLYAPRPMMSLPSRRRVG